jgi:glucose-fructose oxidoreductase
MTWRFAGANFDQMHMNTNLRWVHDHPDAEVVGVCDETPETSTGSLAQAMTDCELSEGDRFDDVERMVSETSPDVVVAGPRNADHAAFVERVAPHDVHVVIEKPMAGSLADADRMLDAMPAHRHLVVNWPVLWHPVKHTVKRLVEADTIGPITEVQYYGGNAGAPPAGSWFYDADAGGGSLLDYLGYGATFSTWFRDGDLPESVTAETYVPPDEEVDVQSSTICRHDAGLSTLQTTWRMLTNPWETEPQPAKGYELVGEAGSISTRERGAPVRVTTVDDPDGYTVETDDLPERYRNLAYYMVSCLENGAEPEGPANATFCREAHRIVETARRSARAGETLELVD